MQNMSNFLAFFFSTVSVLVEKSHKHLQIHKYWIDSHAYDALTDFYDLFKCIKFSQQELSKRNRNARSKKGEQVPSTQKYFTCEDGKMNPLTFALYFILLNEFFQAFLTLR